MSFKTKKISKNFLIEPKVNIKNSNEKEKEELKTLVENMENSSLPFALIKLSIANNFLPLSIETYNKKIQTDIDLLRKKDGSKYLQNSVNTIKSALVSNKLFEKKENKLYGLNIPAAIKYIKNLEKTKGDINDKEKIKINENKKNNNNNNNTLLGKKRVLTKNLYVNKYEKYQHGFQILNDLLESYPKKKEDGIKIKVNFNKYKSSTELIEKNMDVDKICGMLIAFKYFKPFLKKCLYSKNNIDNYNKNLKIDQQISGLKDGLELVQSCIKNLVKKKFEENN